MARPTSPPQAFPDPMSDVGPMDAPEGAGDVVDVRNLTVTVATGAGWLPAVRDVSFAVTQGRRVGIVGESGAGKSLTGLALMRLLPISSRQVGQILFEGQDLMSWTAKELGRIRGRRIAMVYQNPLSSLNPVRTIGHQIQEAILVHDPKADGLTTRERVESLLVEVGLTMPRAYHRFPHELSGGQRQRVVMAMSIACEPALLIADEPTSALDVTTQKVIMDLLVRLVERHRMSLIFVTHDLPLASQYCDEIMVMYAGQIVERAPSSALISAPKHPYSRALVESVCTLDADPRLPLNAIPGQMPGVGAVPVGCPFHPRCEFARDVCRSEEPPVVPTGHTNAFSRCHFVDEVASRPSPLGHA